MTNTLHFSEWRNCIRAQRKVNLCAPGAPKGPKGRMVVRQYEIVCANDAGRAPRKYPAGPPKNLLAKGASRFENLLAPQKTYWPPKKLTGPYLKTKLARRKTICINLQFAHRPIIKLFRSHPRFDECVKRWNLVNQKQTGDRVPYRRVW